MGNNYQLELDDILLSEGGRSVRRSLLLHSCCGPCSSYVLEYLSPHFDISVFFYNPNILPPEEYEKRLFWQRFIAGKISPDINVIVPQYRSDEFLTVARGMEAEPEGGERCRSCFELRLRETAKTAASLGFDLFCTTLTVSPHKNAHIINDIGRRLGGEYGVPFLPSDFKKRGGYLRSVRLSEEYGLYRQVYCGCGLG